MKLFYISCNGNPKKTSYISGSNFPCSKNEKTHFKKSRSVKNSYIFLKKAFLKFQETELTYISRVNKTF